MRGKLAGVGLCVGLLSLAGCDNDRDDGEETTPTAGISASGGTGGSDSDSDSDSESSDNDDDGGERLDVGSGETEGLDCQEGEGLS